MDRVKCNQCGAESVNLRKTKLVCIGCYNKLEEELSLYKLKQLQAENEYLKEALRVIAPPTLSGDWIFTSEKEKTKYHFAQMERWLNQHSQPNVQYVVEGFYSAACIAKQVLNKCNNKNKNKKGKQGAL